MLYVCSYACACVRVCVQFDANIYVSLVNVILAPYSFQASGAYIFRPNSSQVYNVNNNSNKTVISIVNVSLVVMLPW